MPQPSSPRRRAIPRRGSVASSTGAEGFDSCVEILQGRWGDDIGLTIEISANIARFSDGSGTWTIEQEDGAVVLRGARLIGTASAPVWLFPNSVERRWARMEPEGTGDRDWPELFLKFKAARVQQRLDLQSAFQAHNFEGVASLRTAWEAAADAAGATAEELAALDAGRLIVPGICFRHRKFDYRGVILGCEPWCRAPAQWRAQMRVAQLPKGEAQPFYHCLVDERDRPGGQVTFVAEENIVPCNISFPIQAKMADALFTPCDQLGGYLPNQSLMDALQRQVAGGGFLY